jgi:hypothetical protein
VKIAGKYEIDLETRLVRAVLLWPQHKLNQPAEAVLLCQSETEVVFAISAY